MKRFDKYWIGIVIGLLLPALFGLVYMEQFELWYMIQFYKTGIKEPLSRMFMLSVFPDLALLFLFYTTETWKLSKGVLIGAMPFLIASAILSI